jgi:hypothetical protein
MHVSFWPPSLSLTCNQTDVFDNRCFVPSFMLLLKSTLFFSNLSVSLIAASTTLAFDNSMFTVTVKPLCTPGSYVSQSHLHANGICMNCNTNGFSNISDALICSECPAGTAPLNRIGCRDCSGNTYASVSGLSQCVSCPANYVVARSHTECLTLDFRDIPPSAIASNSQIQLPCIKLSSNIFGIVNHSVAKGTVIQIRIFPGEVDGVKVMTNDDVKVTLQGANELCQTATIKVNSNVVEALYARKYTWILQFVQCLDSFCIFSASSDQLVISLPYKLSVRCM